MLGPWLPLLLLQLAAAVPLKSGRSHSPFNNPFKAKKDLIYFLHVPRTAGTSFIADATKALDTPENKKELHYDFYHMEGCYDWREEYQTPPKMAMMLRHPAHLVRSEYLLCAEGPITVLNAVPQADKDGFKTWVQTWHKIIQEGGGKGDFSNGMPKFAQMKVKIPVTYTNLTFKCYNPANIMSQRLTCDVPYKYPEQIDVVRAVKNMQQAWFVGLTEAYQESMCVFHYKVYGKLPKYCNCLDHNNWALFEQSTTSFHDGKTKTPPLAEMEQEIVGKIKDLTTLDLLLYKAAQQRFRDDVREVEEKMNVKLTCRPLPDPEEKLGRSEALPDYHPTYSAQDLAAAAARAEQAVAAMSEKPKSKLASFMADFMD